MKDVEYYMSLPYDLQIIPDPDGGWVIKVTNLRGCITQADRWEDIPAHVEEAKRVWLETAIEAGMPIPEPEPAY